MFPQTRRQFLHQSATFGAAMLTVPGAFAEQLVRTPKSTEGPFYPDKLPLDTDNDLLIINDTIDPAVGEITHLTGKVLDAKGEPIRNAVVEIWQCCSNGSYLHSKSSQREKYDANFQGFGRFATSRKGEYYFRTIKPVAYPGRVPHIHVKVKKNGKDILTTQLYIKGHSLNAADGLVKRIKDQKKRESVMVKFKPISDSKIGELSANFDMVIGYTPEDKKPA